LPEPGQPVGDIGGANVTFPKYDITWSFDVAKTTAKSGVAKHLSVGTESAVLKQKTNKPATIKFVFGYVDGNGYPFSYTASPECPPISETVSPVLSQFHGRVYHIFVPHAEPLKGVDGLEPLHGRKGTPKPKARQQKKGGRNAKGKS